MAKGESGYQLIQDDIKKRSFAPVYWLFGQETYLKDKASEELLEALVPMEQRDWALTSFQGGDLQFDHLVQSITSQTIGADVSVTLIQSFDETRLQPEQLLKIVEVLPRDSHLIILSTNIDRRTKFFKRVNEIGRIAEFNPVSNVDARKWVAKRLKENRVSLEQDAFELLMQRVETDLQLAANEIDKISCYCGRDGGVVTKETLDRLSSLASSGPEDKAIFALVDAVGKRDKMQALVLLRQMLSSGEQPMRIFIMIARQYRLIMGVQRLTRLGYKASDMARVLGCHPFVISKVSAQSRIYSPGQIQEIMELIMEGDRRLKESYEGQALNLEMFLIRLMV